MSACCEPWTLMGSPAEVIGRVESQAAGLGFRHGFGQRPLLARTVQRAGRIVRAQILGIEEFEELPQ